MTLNDFEWWQNFQRHRPSRLTITTITTAELIVILTSVLETIRKAPLAEAQTALGKQKNTCVELPNFYEQLLPHATCYWNQPIGCSAVCRLEFKNFHMWSCDWVNEFETALAHRTASKSDDIYRATPMHSADYAMSWSLSVCPSVTPVLYLNGYTIFSILRRGPP